jgi:uncharacterized protein YjbI with pentapeptide repeats
MTDASAWSQARRHEDELSDLHSSPRLTATARRVVGAQSVTTNRRRRPRRPAVVRSSDRNSESAEWSFYWRFLVLTGIMAVAFIATLGFSIHNIRNSGTWGAVAALALSPVAATVFLASAIRISSAALRSKTRLAKAERLGEATIGLDAGSPIGRVGALYLLENLGIESREHAASVLNALLNFIKERAGYSDYAEAKQDRNQYRIDDDVQTALAVIARLRTEGLLSLSLRVDLSFCNLSGALLRELDFSGVDLHHAILDGADLTNSNFDDANLMYCSLRRARLIGTSMNWAILFGADLTGALLIDTNFSDAMLANTTFQDVHMRKGTLAGANLTGAKVLDSTFADVDFAGSDVLGARFSNCSVTSPSPPSLEDAIVERYTPSGTTGT